MHGVKGLASIVQIVIISALSVSSLLLILGYVKDISGDLDKQLSPVVDCINQKSRMVDACINKEDKIEARFNTALNEEITKIDLSVNGKSFSCGKSICESCTLSDLKSSDKIYINPEKIVSGDKMSASINDCNYEEIVLKPCNS
ncbi:MAG: hypothetical protein AABW89_04770 [Nanoarchaeota archaeon]